MNIITGVFQGWGECTCPDGTMEYVSAKENRCGTDGELECTGGVSGHCNPNSGNPKGYQVSLDCGGGHAGACKLNCGSQEFTETTTVEEPIINNYQSYDIGTGGGKCNCPDGKSHWHGVKADAGCLGKDYGCIGGESPDCGECANGKCARRKVRCGKSLSTFWSNWNSKHYKASDPNQQRCTSNNCKKWGWDKLNENWDHKTVPLDKVAVPSGYGGTCKCPDGRTFLVAATDDTCTSIACDGGTMIDCINGANVKWLDQEVTCGKLVHTPTTCTECWDKNDFNTAAAYSSWEGRHSYTLKQLSTTDPDVPFKLLGSVPGPCLLNCKPGHWSNWEVDPASPRPVTYAANVYKERNPFADKGGTTHCTCPDGKEFATAVKIGRGCDSIDIHCKYGSVPQSNDC